MACSSACSLLSYSRTLTRRLSLEDFVAAHDARLYETGADLTCLIEVAHTTVVNRFEGLNGLHAHLDQANLLDEERLRPGWDMYFMVSAGSFGSRASGPGWVRGPEDGGRSAARCRSAS